MLEVHSGDSIRMTAHGVVHSTLGAITSGVVGTANIRDMQGDVVATAPITEHTNNDWFVDIPAPVDTGSYTAEMIFVVSGAQRTLSEEIFVK